MIQLAQILFILSILVILHELGHYVAAKMFKVRVEKFYLFMDAGFSLFKKKIGDTEWGIGWLPIGGYVKLSGMIDESMDLEQMNQPPQPWEFRSKPAWQRLIIMLGGIIVNLLLAWFLYVMVYTNYGQKYISTATSQQNGLAFGAAGLDAGFVNGDKILSVDGQHQPRFNRMVLDILLGDRVVVDRNGSTKTIILTDAQKGAILNTEGKNFISPRLRQIVVDSLTPKSEFAKAGALKGDKLMAINGHKFEFFDVLTDSLLQHKNQFVLITVNRNGQDIDLKTKVNQDGKLGFQAKSEDKLNYQVINKLSLFEAIPEAVKESGQLLVYNVKQFKLILRPKTEAYKHVKSPIGIARALPNEWNWEFIWNFTALFSIGLAFMNLLPIPGLDGGHALFTIAEMITGKKLSENASGHVQTVGMVILLTLMALTFGKDLFQLIMDSFF